MLVSLLLIQGFTTKTIGASGEGSADGSGATPLANMPPILGDRKGSSSRFGDRGTAAWWR